MSSQFLKFDKDGTKYAISIKRNYYANIETIQKLWHNDVFFGLTGADTIKTQFEPGGLFTLTFKQRGTIHGRFVKITDNEIWMEWNVTGFQKPDEVLTLVKISLSQDNDQCTVTITHSDILTLDSAEAKHTAWTEVLEDLDWILISQK